MTSGPEVFFRFAQPPNALGYCGPHDSSGVAAAAEGLSLPAKEIKRLALAFEGAWPYLELIARRAGKDPLDSDVVEAYWLGNGLLNQVSVFDWGHSASDRFQMQAGARWPAVVNALNAGGLPNHAFHVFCVYPWVGMLKEGHIGPSLDVLNRCRIGWGSVVSQVGDMIEVSRQPLVWENERLALGEAVVEPFQAPSGINPVPGEVVALHWHYVCQVLDQKQLAALRKVHAVHLAIANDELRVGRLEPSR